MVAETVPEKLDSPINYKILVLVVGAAIAFHFSLTFLFDSEQSDSIISVVSFINPLAAAIAGFIVAKRYFGTQVFGKSYLFLSLGFLSVFLGEVAYLVYDLILNIEPYPSIADVFFFAYSPFLILHLIINIKFFQPSTSIITKIWVISIPAVIIAIYALISFSELGETNFDFYYGSIFVAATSITLSLTILGAKIFRQGLLGISWLILLFGVLSLTFADDWYYYLEFLGNYDLSHPVNILWYAGYWIVVYALIKHKQTM